jgi:hypothetical protein
MCATLRLHLLAAGILAGVSIPASALAQSVAHSFTELASVVSVGQTITVTDATGAETKGRVTQFSPTSLTLAFDSATREFAESEVRLIQQRHKDSLLNGALIGAGITVAVPLVYFALICSDDSEDCGGEAAVAIAGYAGLGLGIGTLIDLAVTGKETIYVPGQAPKPSVSIAPLVTRDRKGVQVALRF